MGNCHCLPAQGCTSVSDDEGVGDGVPPAVVGKPAEGSDSHHDTSWDEYFVRRISLQAMRCVLTILDSFDGVEPVARPESGQNRATGA